MIPSFPQKFPEKSLRVVRPDQALSDEKIPDARIEKSENIGPVADSTL